MKVVYTTEALADLDGILNYIANHYPAISEAFENRLHAVVARIARWPESAQEVAERISNETVEILYVHHAAREETR
jgi:plasmid stabilization system protein ParE